MASTPPDGGSNGSRGEILRSNVDDGAPVVAESRSSHFAVLPIVLGVLLVFLLGAGAALLLISSQGRPPASAVALPAVRATSPAVSATNANGLPDINGISCDALESTVQHIHVHLAIFVNGEEEQVPLGIGIGQPWQVTDSAEGPFVNDGACFYWLHTHTEDGIVHIESPVRRRFTLGDFFAIWQVPLSATQLGPAQGPVIAYVNGSRDDTAPPDIALRQHQRIQLNIGGDVPPYVFDFPPGD